MQTQAVRLLLLSLRRRQRHRRRSRISVSIFLPESKFSPEVISSISARLHELGVEHEIACEALEENDWANSWKAYYHPIRTGKHLVIVPVWEDFTPEPDDVVILMDPGMAFGTGTHETTRLCAALIEKYMRPGARMIDVGCGSGILAICASKLGAADCFACDIDPVSIRVAKENTELNGTPNVTCRVSDLLSAVPKAGGGYDVCCANIVADIIIRLAPDVGEYLSDDGVLIVSGIITERRDETVSALNEAGFEVIDDETENGWYCAALKRRV